MSTSVRLPSELREFLGLPGPQSILLRGPPGSGKTTLTLALLEAFPGEQILVTSRVTRPELQREFPWLGQNSSSSIRVIDTTSSLEDLATAQRATSRLGDLVRSSDASVRDVRNFLWLPPALQEAWAQLDELRPSIVVVDSWDALVEGYLGDARLPDGGVPDRAQVERLLLRRMASAPVHLVLVLEREEQSQLDYLTNAVVQTQIDVQDGRLERWLLIRKLRGLRIESALYPFTLEGGKFECIEPLKPYRSVRLLPHEPEPDPLPGHMWPGSRAFAESFGRPPVGQVSLLELDPEVPQHVPEVLLTPFISQTVEKGGAVLILPEGRADPARLFAAMHGKVPKSKFLLQVRFVVAPPPARTGRAELPPPMGDFARNLMVLRMRAPEANPATSAGSPMNSVIGDAPAGAEPSPSPTPPGVRAENEAMQFLQSGGTPGSPGLCVIHTAGIYALASALRTPLTPEAVAAFPAALQEMASATPLHTVMIGRSGSPVFDGLRPLAVSHLRIRSRQGRVLMHGARPWTPSFLLVEGQAPAPYGLLRVI